MSANPVRVLRQWVRSLWYELVEDEWDRAEAYCEEQVEPHVVEATVGGQTARCGSAGVVIVK